jgi:hypothetical protein
MPRASLDAILRLRFSIVTIEERLEAITQSLELLAHMQRSNDQRLDKLAERMDNLVDRMAQVMEAVGGLARITEIHEHRLDSRDSPPDKLAS